MLDIKLIRENPEKIKEGCRKKQVNVDIKRLLELDKKKRNVLQQVEKLRADRNVITEKIAQEKTSELIEQAQKIKEQINEKEKALKQIEPEYQELMLCIPNPSADDVHQGKDESENKIIRKWGEPTKFDFDVKNHLEIGEALDLIDVKRASKVSGTRFGYLKGKLVLLEFALIRFAFDTLIEQGFVPILPPVLIKTESMKGMGYMEHGGADDMFILNKENLVLVGTSEQSIGPMHMNETFDINELPKRYAGFSTCFRKEAGSYGKDTKGILRVHQFNKLEMFSFAAPENGDKEHEFLLSMEEKLMQALELPYQVSKMCSGDLGGPAARKYDIEAWMPGQDKYREVTSTSTTTDFQARRLNIRYKDKDKTGFVHMLNGTGFSERPLIAILENYQQKDGSVKIPKVLQKYLNFTEIKKE